MIKRRGFLLIIIILALTGCNGHPELKPFASDGCSWFPDGTFAEGDLWLKCCVEHDRSYWAGGARPERLTADRELAECVEGVGAPGVAKLMRVGVWFGGSPYLPLYFRWGFGWPYPRGYQPLTAEDQELVRRMSAGPGPAGSTVAR